MLVRDKIGEELEEQFKEYDTSDVEIIRLQTNEELFNAILDRSRTRWIYYLYPSQQTT